jgi:hypothetical protein
MSYAFAPPVQLVCFDKNRRSITSRKPRIKSIANSVFFVSPQAARSNFKSLMTCGAPEFKVQGHKRWRKKWA